MLKTGIVSSAYFRYDDYKSGLRKMRDDGYDCCDYHGFIHADSPLYVYSEERLKTYLYDVLQGASESDIEFFQLHAQWPLACATKEETRQSIEAVKKSIIGAGLLHCNNVVVHTFAPHGWLCEVDGADTFAKNVENFGILCDYAKRFHVNICIENLPFHALDISRVSTVIKLIDAVGRENCKMCFDVGHAHVFHDDIYKDIVGIGDRLQVVHVHDNNDCYDSHMMPWQGTIMWNKFSEALKEIDYDGCVSLETYIDSDMPLQFKSGLRKILSDMARKLASI